MIELFGYILIGLACPLLLPLIDVKTEDEEAQE